MTRVQEKIPDLKVCKIQNQLRKEMVYLEKEFLKLKNEFNQNTLENPRIMTPLRQDILS
jgi:hypothetical protein